MTAATQPVLLSTASRPFQEPQKLARGWRPPSPSSVNEVTACKTRIGLLGVGQSTALAMAASIYPRELTKEKVGAYSHLINDLRSAQVPEVSIMSQIPPSLRCVQVFCLGAGAHCSSNLAQCDVASKKTIAERTLSRSYCLASENSVYTL